MRTYDEILTEMLTEYGDAPDSEEYKELEILAHEIFALESEIDRAEKGAFVLTAEGGYLDRHAAGCGMERRSGTKAKGTLEFSVNTPLGYDLTIPKDTVVCRSDNIQAEYKTYEDAVLTGGNLAVTVKAESVNDGREYNCSAGLIDTGILVPSAVDSVRNTTAFIGGSDKERDDSLRKRIISFIAVLPTGANAQTYIDLALEVSEIASAAVKPDYSTGKVYVYVYGDNAPVSEEGITEVYEKIKSMRELFSDVSVQNAEEETVDISLYISPENDLSESEVSGLISEADTLTQDYINMLGVGENFYRAGLTAYLMEKLPIKNITIPSAVQDVVIGPSQIAVTGTINVSEEVE